MSHAALVLLVPLLALPDAGVADGPPSSQADAGVAQAPPSLAQESFPIVRQPRARRIWSWTRSRRNPKWESNYTQVHFSRFLDLAQATLHLPWTRQRTDRQRQEDLFRFANAVIMDLRDALRVACPGQRCAPLLLDVDRVLAPFLRLGPHGYTPVEKQPSGDRWHTWYAWSFAAATTRIDLGCDDMLEEPEVTCELTVALPDGLGLSFNPKNSRGASPEEADFILRRQSSKAEPLGTILFERSDTGAPRVVISGALLAPGTHRR